MGARLDKELSYYDAATRLAPDDVGIHWQYARALVALDASEHAALASQALARAIAANAGDHVEQVMQSRAAQLAAALTGDKESAQKLAQVLL